MDREAWRAAAHGLQSVGHVWATELNCTEAWIHPSSNSSSTPPKGGLVCSLNKIKRKGEVFFYMPSLPVLSGFKFSLLTHAGEAKINSRTFFIIKSTVPSCLFPFTCLWASLHAPREFRKAAFYAFSAWQARQGDEFGFLTMTELNRVLLLHGVWSWGSFLARSEEHTSELQSR